MVGKNVFVVGFFIVIAAFVGSSYYFGFRYGESKCQNTLAKEQVETVKKEEERTENAYNAVNSADLDSIRRLLCETARDDCNKERASNTSS